MPFAGTQQQATAQQVHAIDPKIQELRALQAMVPPLLAAHYPDIIQMLFQSPSLSFSEKQYWIHLLPLMNQEQVEKLRNILMSERSKLFDIQQQYNTSSPKTVEDASKERIAHIQAKKQVIRTQEALDQQNEAMHEDELLDALKNL